MKNIFHSILIIISLLCSYTVHAQTDTAFWFVAPNISNEDLYGGNVGFNRPIYLYIATYSLASTVTISEPANGSFSPIVVNLPANSATSVDLTPYLTIVEDSPVNTVNNYGIYVRATNIITAYYENLSYSDGTDPLNPESFSFKGHNALGTSFYTPFQQTYNNSAHFSPTAYSGFDIVASQDNTQVTINPTQNIFGHNAGTPFSITLNKGQTFSCIATSQAAANHPSGSSVTSNKPVAVTVKDDLDSIIGEDLEGDQIIPINVVGNEYVVIQSPNYFNDLAVIVGTQNGTQVSVNGSYLTTINAGQSYQYALSTSGYGADYITSTLPIYVYQLTTSVGEAGAAILPPLTCTGSTDVCVTRATPDAYYAFIITKNGNQGNFLCNGSAAEILSSQFQSVPGTAGDWQYAVVDLSSFITPGGVCRVTNSSGLFSMGILEGDVNGSSYAYFTNFITESNTVTAVNICSTGSAILHPSLSGTHYWNTGSTADSITVTQAGTYWVQNSLIGGCTESDTFKVSGNAPVITIVPDSVTICSGQSLTLTANGALTYVWSPVQSLSSSTGDSVIATPIIQTTYTVTGTSSGGCTGSGFDVVFVSSPPDTPLIIQHGDTLISTAKQGNQWARNDTVLAGATNQTYILTISGEYKVVTQNPANGCSSTSDTGYYTPTGIDRLTSNSGQLSVYPNPTTGEIIVNVNSSAIDVKDWYLQIIDVLGRTVYTKQSLNYNNDIDLPSADGVYFITVINKTGRVVIPVMKQ